MSISAKPKIAISSIDSDNNQFIDNFARSVRQAGFATVKTPYALKDFKGIGVAIFHWPTFLAPTSSFWTSMKALLKLALARKIFGTKVVWVAHNLAPHEGATNPFIKKIFFGQLDGIIYLSHSSRRLIREKTKISSCIRELVTVHGLYESANPIISAPKIDDDRLCRLLSFGQIRPYKGLERLILEAGKFGTGFHLTILGKANDVEYVKLLETAAAESPNVRLNVRDVMISDSELEAAIDASNGVVLPYQKILNSGAAIHALSRNRPVLVPNQGSMPELQEILGVEWVQTFDDEIRAQDIISFGRSACQKESGDRVDMAPFRWELVTTDLSGFFQNLTEDSLR